MPFIIIKLKRFLRQIHGERSYVLRQKQKATATAQKLESERGTRRALRSGFSKFHAK